MTDKIYRIEEMIDSMNQSIENIDDVIAMQTKLIELVSNSEDFGPDDDFTVKLRESNANLVEQRQKLLAQCAEAAALVSICETDPAYKDAVNATMSVFKIFDDGTAETTEA